LIQVNPGKKERECWSSGVGGESWEGANAESGKAERGESYLIVLRNKGIKVI